MTIFTRRTFSTSSTRTLDCDFWKSINWMKYLPYFVSKKGKYRLPQGEKMIKLPFFDRMIEHIKHFISL